MTKEEQHKDGFFKSLFGHGEKERAPHGFADRVMQAIEAESLTEADERWSWSGWWLWGTIVFAIACLSVMVFYVDFSFMGSIFTGWEPDGSRISQFISNMGSSLGTAFESFSLSSISIIILVAVAALLLADRLLRRRPGMGINVI